MFVGLFYYIHVFLGSESQDPTIPVGTDVFVSLNNSAIFVGLFIMNIKNEEKIRFETSKQTEKRQTKVKHIELCGPTLPSPPSLSVT